MAMGKITRIIIGIPVCFTVLVAWFSWSALQAASPLAIENLRGAALSIAAAIDQLTVADPSLRSLARYTTPDIAYFALVDRNGIIRFHTHPGLIGQLHEPPADFAGISEQRERLGTGEEVYLLRSSVHTGQDEYRLILALHTYRADQVIRRAKTGVTVVSALTVALWGLTLLVIFMVRREARHHREMNRREELARLGEMGALMAHEIRNPLAGIKGFAQLLEMTDDIEQAHRHAEKIVAQSLRMEALVDDLLAFARDDQGTRQEADLTALIEKSVGLVNMEAAAQRIEISVDTPKPFQAEVVDDRIMQLLLNLLKNAIQAMPDGGIIAVSGWHKGGGVNISVKDSGSGILPEQLPHIFEPFWTSKTQGTGLGLALCKKVAEEHGGSLTVASSLDAGTEFIVTLPARK